MKFRSQIGGSFALLHNKLEVNDRGGIESENNESVCSALSINWQFSMLRRRTEDLISMTQPATRRRVPNHALVRGLDIDLVSHMYHRDVAAMKRAQKVEGVTANHVTCSEFRYAMLGFRSNNVLFNTPDASRTSSASLFKP